MNARSPSPTGSKLIARIWHGVTDAARAEEYAAYLERTGARECRATPGNRGVYVLRRIKQDRAEFTLDRKSTRLNSSHSQISYAVFCLKKQKNLSNLMH